MTRDTDTTAAASYFDHKRFNQSFTLPPSDNRPEGFKVTYADFGNRRSEHVILFCGPLVGSRFVLTTKHEFAEQHGVRIISPDRPGFGGTPDVPPADRVRVWLEIVETLLQHLGIQHVAIFAYSGGTVYAMNILLHLRHLLHPVHPYVALCTPWVHTSHSGVSALKLASLLPNGVIGTYDRLLRMISDMGPALRFSNILSGFVPSLSGGSDAVAPGVDPDAVAREEGLLPQLFGRIKNEDIIGISQDVLLLLKRDQYPECWGTWGDYDTLVPLLAEAESERRRSEPDTTSPLRVRVFFAASDMLIGTTLGPAWLDDCWRPEQRGDNIDYSSVTIPKTTHDTVLDLRYGVFEQIVQDITSQNID
ncbi:hypothetical protein F4777DRAFT_551562 [Nemania sp. FL0916]|nr:hypothetical protein F4777DRAFT_551562 [Nemania sp. FL0916]